jgi:hypothetical protein
MIRNQLETVGDDCVFNILETMLGNVKDWEFPDASGCAWYRGQDTESPPIPSVLRNKYDESSLAIAFRNRAAALMKVPETDRVDQWLFLMQHYGAPTRLLDWTESPVLALFFALISHSELCDCKKERQNPTIWAMHPHELNRLSGLDGFPNTWVRRDKKVKGKTLNTNPGLEHFRLAFHPRHEWNREINHSIVQLPIAVHSNYLDIRIHSQRSCFTIHGIENQDFESLFAGTRLVSEGFLLKFTIPGTRVEDLLTELMRMGISYSTVFPDLEHLGKELKKRFAVGRPERAGAHEFGVKSCYHGQVCRSEAEPGESR